MVWVRKCGSDSVLACITGYFFSYGIISLLLPYRCHKYHAGMNIPKSMLDEFSCLYAKEFGEKIDEDVAREMMSRLLDFYIMLVRNSGEITEGSNASFPEGY